MSDGPMTVGDLVALLQRYDSKLLVELRIQSTEVFAEDRLSQTTTFITKPQVSERHGQQTYLGDRDVLQIDIDEDEP